MISLFLITHGMFGESLIQTACHVLGAPPPQLLALGMNGESPETLLPRAKEILLSLANEQGVLILNDMIGASPANLTKQLLIPGVIEGVSGVNLPMLLRALTYRNLPMEALIEKILECSSASILRIPS